MVTKKKPAAKKRAAAPAAAKKKTYHKKSDASYIPAAAATVGLVMANANNIKEDLNKISQIGLGKMARVYVPRGYYQKYISGNQLVNDAIYTAGGMIGGELVKRYAPKVIKAPLGKIAKKIPKVI